MYGDKCWQRSALLAVLRRLLQSEFDARWLTTGFTAWWVLFYVWFWVNHPG